MKARTLKLLAVTSGIYIGLLILLRSLISETTSSTVPLLAVPLVVLAIVLVLDLTDRATKPTIPRARKAPRRIRARDVQFLTQQLNVGTKASPEYFDGIVRDRLRDLLVERVSLETGLIRDIVKRTLQDPTDGPRLLKDREIYRLLYYSAPKGAETRLQMLREIIDRIEGWKA